MEFGTEILDKFWIFFKSNYENNKYPLDVGISNFCEKVNVDYFNDCDEIEEIFIELKVLKREKAGLIKGENFFKFKGFNYLDDLNPPINSPIIAQEKHIIKVKSLVKVWGFITNHPVLSMLIGSSIGFIFYSYLHWKFPLFPCWDCF